MLPNRGDSAFKWTQSPTSVSCTSVVSQSWQEQTPALGHRYTDDAF